MRYQIKYLNCLKIYQEMKFNKNSLQCYRHPHFLRVLIALLAVLISLQFWCNYNRELIHIKKRIENKQVCCCWVISWNNSQWVIYWKINCGYQNMEIPCQAFVNMNYQNPLNDLKLLKATKQILQSILLTINVI